MKVSTKQFLIIGAVILVVFIIIGIWFYRKGKKQVTIAEVPFDSPFESSNSNNPYSVSDSELVELSDRLYREMDGFGIWRDADPYKDLIKLSDTDFVKVYNIFNTNHQSKSGETLKKWIENEYVIGELASYIKSILDRMGRLNLI